MNIKKLFNRKPRCRHIRKDGGPCQSPPQAGKDVCFAHDPDRAQQRLEARKRRGPTSTHEPVVIPPGFDPGPLETYEQLDNFIDRVAQHVTRGEMDLRTGRRCIDRANTIMRRLNREDRERHRAKKAELRERERRAQAREAEIDEAIAKGKVWILPLPKTTFYIN